MKVDKEIILKNIKRIHNKFKISEKSILVNSTVLEIYHIIFVKSNSILKIQTIEQ